jgi:hypothetical protein
MTPFGQYHRLVYQISIPQAHRHKTYFSTISYRYKLISTSNRLSFPLKGALTMHSHAIPSDWSWLVFSGYDFSDYEIPSGIKHDPTDIALETKSNAQPFDLFELEDVPF